MRGQLRSLSLRDFRMGVGFLVLLPPVQFSCQHPVFGFCVKLFQSWWEYCVVKSGSSVSERKFVDRDEIGRFRTACKPAIEPEQASDEGEIIVFLFSYCRYCCSLRGR